MSVIAFLSEIAKIKKEAPVYRKGGSCRDGTCDCIGMIIAALRRMGVKWQGIHGSNYCARYAVQGLAYTDDARILQLGDVVFKARTPKEDKYDLPSTYKHHPDRLDYYHVGVVTAVDPIAITHCTSGGQSSIRVDERLGAWRYFGKLTCLMQEMDVTAATVTAKQGKTVNLRQAPSKRASILCRIPIGMTVQASPVNDAWAQVRLGEKVGYVMREFLEMRNA